MLRFGLTLVIAAISLFAAGIGTGLAHGHPVLQVLAVTIGCLVTGAPMVMAARRPESSLGGAALGGVFVGVLALVAVTYGNYFAHVLGWRSLDVAQFGSDDNRGQVWISIFVGIYGLPSAFVGAVVASLIWTFGRRSPSA